MKLMKVFNYCEMPAYISILWKGILKEISGGIEECYVEYFIDDPKEKQMLEHKHLIVELVREFNKYLIANEAIIGDIVLIKMY
jgi:hypothetical protein